MVTVKMVGASAGVVPLFGAGRSPQTDVLDQLVGGAGLDEFVRDAESVAGQFAFSNMSTVISPTMRVLCNVSPDPALAQRNDRLFQSWCESLAHANASCLRRGYSPGSPFQSCYATSFSELEICCDREGRFLSTTVTTFRGGVSRDLLTRGASSDLDDVHYFSVLADLNPANNFPIGINMPENFPAKAMERVKEWFGLSASSRASLQEQMKFVNIPHLMRPYCPNGARQMGEKLEMLAKDPVMPQEVAVMLPELAKFLSRGVEESPDAELIFYQDSLVGADCLASMEPGFFMYLHGGIFIGSYLDGERVVVYVPKDGDEVTIFNSSGMSEQGGVTIGSSGDNDIIIKDAPLHLGRLFFHSVDHQGRSHSYLWLYPKGEGENFRDMSTADFITQYMGESLTGYVVEGVVALERQMEILPSDVRREMMIYAESRGTANLILLDELWRKRKEDLKNTPHYDFADDFLGLTPTRISEAATVVKLNERLVSEELPNIQIGANGQAFRLDSDVVSDKREFDVFVGEGDDGEIMLEAERLYETPYGKISFSLLRTTFFRQGDGSIEIPIDGYTMSSTGVYVMIKRNGRVFKQGPYAYMRLLDGDEIYLGGMGTEEKYEEPKEWKFLGTVNLPPRPLMDANKAAVADEAGAFE